MEIILLSLGVTLILGVGLIPLYLSVRRRAADEAYSRAAYVAELWTTQKYGPRHDCHTLSACTEMGQLADKLRKLSSRKRGLHVAGA